MLRQKLLGLLLTSQGKCAARSASADSFAEDVGIVPVVVAELKLGDVERQIFGADFVERADHAALENRPEALDRLGMDRADDVLPSGMIDDAVRILGIQAAIANPLVRTEQANLLRNRAAHEGLENVAANAADDAGNDLALALDRAGYRDLTRAGAPAPSASALVPVPVLRLAADEGFINFNDPH